MWKIIRENANLKQVDIARHFNISRQAVNYFERKTMPNYIKAYYLRLRGMEADLILAEHFEREVKNANIRNK